MTDRRRDARHPFEVAPIALLVVVAGAQLVLGPQGSRVVLSMSEFAQRAFAAVMLVGACAVLASMVKAGRSGRLIELVGLFTCAITLGVYSMTVVSVTPAWLTNPAFAFMGVATACAFRAGQILRHRQ